MYHNDEQRVYLKNHNATQSLIISRTNLPTIGSSHYTLAVWVFINEWNYQYGAEKNIVARYTTDKQPVPSITLASHTNDALINLTYFDPKGNNKERLVHTCKIQNIPLQKWSHIVLSVNNRIIDVYLDGKLVKTCVIPGVPVSGINSDLYVSGSLEGDIPGFSGRITDLKFMKTATNPSQAYNLYKKGNSLTSLLFNNSYKLKVALLKNNEVRRSIII